MLNELKYLVLFGLFLGSMNVTANQDDLYLKLYNCISQTECKPLYKELGASIIDGQSHYLIFGPIANKTMNQKEAIDYCKSIGERLPTAKELAIYSQSKGAVGIIEVASNNANITYFSLMEKSTLDSGSRDLFYFNYRGYSGNQEDRQKFFWSSSVSRQHQNEGFYMDGDFGSISVLGSNDYDLNVRCVSQRK